MHVRTPPTIAKPAPPAEATTPKAAPAEAGLAVANRVATREPIAAGFVNAVQVYPFAGESLISVAAGDTARWAITIRQAVRARRSARMSR